jgi:endoglucanase
MASSLLLGVNLAGAEFGSNVPGVFGVDYTYPTHTEIDYYASKGMQVIRLPFLWERLQHSENAALDSTELARLDDVVNYATGKGLKIEIEPHDYGYGFGALIGSAQTPNSAFADFWGKLAQHFSANANVVFGLMNEPHDQSASTWLTSANTAIAAIRSAGAMSQEILVPGSYWDGAWTWTSTDNAAVIGTGVQDPAHNFAFEAHQYLDADGSGTHPGAVSATIGVERLTAITQWAEATGNHLFLGEVGVTTDQTSLTAFDGMLSYMQQHPDAWQAVTYWAGGPWWGNYMFSIEPQNGVDKPQMDVLVQHLSSSGYHCTPGNDQISVTGNNLLGYCDDGNNDQIYFQGNQNQLFGGTGNDWLGVSGNNNALAGGSGNNWIGATGNSNTLAAGSGNSALFAVGTGNFLYAGAGQCWEGVSGSQNQIFGGAGADWMGASGSNNAISGGSGASTLFANGTSNTLSGGSGNDWIGVSGSNNFLFGGSGNSYIAATGSANTLDPYGAGTDTLFAAANAHDHNAFVYHPGYGNVTIDNFVPQVGDVINIAGFGFTHVTQFAPYVTTSADGSIALAFSATSRLTLEGIAGGLQDSWFNFHA